ncbi:hypothetical protein E2C01_031209 [Portunus trituberculatus]|uniref:Uncharacterized protein n=1 Tax=Portunus trituberculatus TaxID=210409 RepID=A0A5B7EXH9_PORTR|nr:hypothetical protein [Portunus trituberculatus]
MASYYYLLEFRSGQGQSKLFTQNLTWTGKEKWREPKMPQEFHPYCHNTSDGTDARQTQ